MKSTYLHVKHAPNNIQGVQKNFDLQQLLKGKKLSKSHLTFILRR